MIEELVKLRKRLEFLNELKERNLIIPKGQIERTENKISFLESQILSDVTKNIRDFSIEYILN